MVKKKPLGTLEGWSNLDDGGSVRLEVGAGCGWRVEKTPKGDTPGYQVLRHDLSSGYFIVPPTVVWVSYDHLPKSRAKWVLREAQDWVENAIASQEDHKPLKTHNIGTEDHPLRASQVPMLVSCDWRYVLEFLECISDDGSREAAETGTAVGKVLASWHQGMGIIEALESVKCDHPLADHDQIEKTAFAYIRDERNNPRTIALGEYFERSVKLVLPPHPIDPTGYDIHITGHIDLIRKEDDGTHTLWDYKNGKPGGFALANTYAYQQLVYYLATKQILPSLRTGGIVRLRDYIRREVLAGKEDPQVFYYYSLTDDAMRGMVDVIRLRVALARAGYAGPRPDVHCVYCPADGLHFCTKYVSKMGGLNACDVAEKPVIDLGSGMTFESLIEE